MADGIAGQERAGMLADVALKHLKLKEKPYKVSDRDVCMCW